MVSIRHTQLHYSEHTCTISRGSFLSSLSIQECLLLTLVKERNDQTRHFFLARCYGRARLLLNPLFGYVTWVFVCHQTAQTRCYRTVQTRVRLRCCSAVCNVARQPISA
eukprot:Protomagalhaensia_wolfi_Nauph_80__3760@NODE_3801_length_706_cov_6_137931_g2999_i0_p3_GENE_NODE_3801_length_706_cov_6_137931_g2999_i0NODE_3801_length_706_cov_6_137931_g2999_i0_p3_ORF_typecomplete_len109_score10_22HTH_Tnp_4/PF13613_6/0_12HTH_Tnp_4/PF13613_6/1_2e03_NODE_3801_length_706_cov_6_137931_g2999_i0144470